MINWEKIKRPYTFRQGSSLKEPTLGRGRGRCASLNSFMVEMEVVR